MSSRRDQSLARRDLKKTMEHPSPLMTESGGKQVSKLRLALSKALEASMGNCSKEKLAAAFPSLTTDEPQCLDVTRDQIVDFLTVNCKEEFERILGEREIPDKLLSMDSLQKVEDSDSTLLEKNHGLAPLKSIQAHILAAKREELNQLNVTLQCLETDNLGLVESVLKKRSEVQALKGWVHQLTLDKLAADSIGELESCL